MGNDPNTLALDQYARGWEMGNSSIIYPVLLRTFKFTLRDEQFNDLIRPVTRDVLKDFMDILRKKVEEHGGPSTSDRFMKFTHVNRTKVTKIIQENACTRHHTVEASSCRAQPRRLPCKN